MKPNLKKIVYLFFFCSLFFSCNEKTDLLESAKNKAKENNYISFTETAFYPIPDSELVNTLITKTEILYNQNNSLGYNFIQKRANTETIYYKNQLQIVNHESSTNRFYLPKHFKNQKHFLNSVKNSFRNNWSPLTLLKKKWEFVKDTIIDNKSLKNYFRIENEREYNGMKIKTEQHIFINSEALLEKFERRNYNDGKLSQRVRVNFSDYLFINKKESLEYKTHSNYVSFFGLKKPIKNLKVGNIAPTFNGITMKGDSISNRKFLGKKILLNFSVISCGNCKMTLDYINQKDYKLTDKVSFLYINPEDNQTRMEKYMKNINIPFPIIASAKDIAKNYGVNSFPRFVLINEKGVIEKIVKGYSKEFLDKFRQ